MDRLEAIPTQGPCLLDFGAACKPTVVSNPPIPCPALPPTRLQLLRISEEDEYRGLDVSKHGGSVYNTDQYM